MYDIKKERGPDWDHHRDARTVATVFWRQRDSVDWEHWLRCPSGELAQRLMQALEHDGFVYTCDAEQSHTRSDEYFMRIAIDKARAARHHGNQPFGAVLVANGRIVAASGDRLLSEFDVIQHAEMRAISKATRSRRSVILNDCTLYTTFEPCVMCASAAIYAFIPRVVIGATRDQVPHFFKQRKVRLYDLLDDADHEIEIVEGVLADAIIELFNGLERYAPTKID